MRESPVLAKFPVHRSGVVKTPLRVHIIRDFLEPAIAGEDPRDVERLTVKMRRAVAGHPSRNQASRSLSGNILGSRVDCRFIACSERCPREHSHQDVSFRSRPQRAAEIARWAMAKGLRALKVKVGMNPSPTSKGSKPSAPRLGRRFDWVSMPTAAGLFAPPSDDPPDG